MFLMLSTLSVIVPLSKAQSLPETLDQYVSDLKKNPNDNALHEKIIKLAQTMSPAPAIPEEARKHYVKGLALFKDAKTPDDQVQVIDEFKQAIFNAPWWQAAYYNLYYTYKTFGKYTEAIAELKLYQLFKLSNAEVRSLQDTIYVLEARAEKEAYVSVKIENQVWMAKNLGTTNFNDGTAIPLVTDNGTWAGLTTPAYCWYNNNEANNKSTYGALYNWYTVNTGKLCPAGWHVPTLADWITLTTYLGGDAIAGGKLKETGIAHWTPPNTGATNETGFTALPGGSHDNDGIFRGFGMFGYWWSATVHDATYSYFRNMPYNVSAVQYGTGFSSKQNGFSVRCIRDY